MTVRRPLATTVPMKIVKEIREIAAYTGVEESQAVQILLGIGIAEWRKRVALELLRDGKVTFLKAAKIASLDLWEFADTLKDAKVEWVRTT